MMAEADGLHALLAAGEAVVPGMAGRLGPPTPGEIATGADNHDAIRRLAGDIAARAPEGGRAYWSVRTWGMLTWQPAVLAVMGVHRFGVVPQVDAMGQCVAGPMVLGYSLPPEATMEGGDAARIAEAGARLRRLANALLADLRAEMVMKPVLAGRLLADRVLGTLVRASANPVAHADNWLAAMGLEGQSALMPLVLPGGGHGHGLDRRACCLAYRVEGGGLCASCPKLPKEERHQRLAAEYEAHV